MRTVSLVLIASAALCSFPICANAINYSSIDGNCNIVQQNVQVSDGSTQINVIDCKPKALDKQFRVRYVWLNGVGISYLAANYVDKNLTQLLGRNPIVYRNQVYSRIETIISRFGKRLPSDSDNESRTDNLIIVSDNKETKDVGLESDIPKSIAKDIRFYAGDDLIAWPDMSALSSLYETAQWPAGWKKSYYLDNGQNSVDFTGDIESAQANAISCVHLRKEISANDVKEYYTNLSLLLNSFSTGKYDLSVMPGVVELSRNNGKIQMSVGQVALNAISYFTQYNWPSGFLYADGGANIDYCGGSKIGFSVTPMKLFLKVAVVESLSPALDIQGLRFGYDKGPALRTSRNGTEVAQREDGVISLGYGDSVVVPMEIELRDSLPVEGNGFPVDDEEDVVDTQAGQSETETYNAVSSAPIDSFTAKLGLDGGKEISITKQKSAYEPVVASSDSGADAYIFGPSYELNAIKLEEQWIDVRKAPETALVANETGGGGSCPFVFVDDGHETEIAMGRVLVGAHSRQLSTESVVKLPDRTKVVFIRELEPEVTFISRIVVRGGGEERELLKDTVLKPGEQVSLEIPEMPEGDRVLVVSGYYESMETILAKISAERPYGK